MILKRYILNSVLKTQFAILLILLILFISQQLVKILGSAVNGAIPYSLVFDFLVLGIPLLLQFILPLSLFLALLFTFGKMYVDHEIVAMKSCGAGSSVLLAVALKLALITTFFATINIVWFTPLAIDKQTTMLAKIKANPSLFNFNAGRFINFNNRVLFINKTNKDELHNIFIFENTANNEIPNLTIAKKAQIKSKEDGTKVFNLEKVTNYENLAKTNSFRIANFSEYESFLIFNNAQSNAKLLQRTSFQMLLELKDPKARAEFYWRLALIISVIIMAVLAVPLSYVNPRQGRFAKFVPALLLYLSYFLGQSFLKSNAIKLDPNIFMPLLFVVFGLIAIIFNLYNSSFGMKFSYWLRTRVKN